MLKSHVKMNKDTKIMLRLAERVGMPYTLDRPNPYQWDGEMAYFGGIEPNNIAHEIAHYLVAGPRKRKKKEFGIGPAPDADVLRHSYADYRVSLGRYSHGVSADDEAAASVLGIKILEALGLDRLQDSDMDEHGWNNTKANKARFNRLAKSKKYYENGVPICLKGFK